MITLVTALECEAKPFVDAFRLQPNVIAGGLRVYAENDLRLVVTGVGKPRAAAYCRRLLAVGQASNHAWLSVGIAGHRDLEIGTGVWGRYVKDRETGRVWSLTSIASFPGIPTTVCTVAEADREYSEDAVFDMEAAGMCASVTAVAPDAVIQCYKVISDNRNSGVAGITPSAVYAMMQSHISAVAEAVAAMTALTTGAGTGIGDCRP